MIVRIEKRDGLARAGKVYEGNNEVMNFPGIIIPNGKIRFGREIGYYGSYFIENKIDGKIKIPPYIWRELSVLSEDIYEVNKKVFHEWGGRVGIYLGDKFIGDDRTFFVVVPNLGNVISNPRKFVRTVIDVHSKSHGSLIYGCGIGAVNEIAISVYLGIDLIDFSKLLERGLKGIYLTTEGEFGDEIIEICECEGCKKGDAISHNFISAKKEMTLIRNCIYSGNLRNIVEQRCVSSTHLSAILKEADIRYYEYIEKYIPVKRNNVMLCTTNLSFNMPEIVRYRKKIVNLYEKPKSKKVCVLLPCSYKKPYSYSMSHKIIGRVLKRFKFIHEVIITSPLGIVPREIEKIYPASHYDIPVIGIWEEDEKKMIIEMLQAFLERNRYDYVISYLPNMEFLESIGIESIIKDGKATDNANLRKLSAKLMDIGSSTSFNFKSDDLLLEEIQSIFRFMYGNFKKDMLKDGKILKKGNKIFVELRGKSIVEYINDEVIPTIDGGRFFLERKKYVVYIHDFLPKGTIFSTGVEGCTEDIRPGQYAVAVHDDDVRAVGRCLVSYKDVGGRSKCPVMKVRTHM